MKKFTIDEVREGKLPKGSFILIRWTDASEIRTLLGEHIANPEVISKDWGIYLGVSGRTKHMLILGKDIVEVYNEWGASRIPVELIEEVVMILPREEMAKVIREIQALGKRVNLRKYKRREEIRCVFMD